LRLPEFAVCIRLRVGRRAAGQPCEAGNPFGSASAACLTEQQKGTNHLLARGKRPSGTSPSTPQLPGLLHPGRHSFHHTSPAIPWSTARFTSGSSAGDRATGAQSAPCLAPQTSDPAHHHVWVSRRLLRSFVRQRGTNRSVCPGGLARSGRAIPAGNGQPPVNPASSRAGALCPAPWFRCHPRRPGLDRTPQPRSSCRANPEDAARRAGRPYEKRLENSLAHQAVEEPVNGALRIELSRQIVSGGAGFQESGDPGRGRRLSVGGLAPVIGVEDPGYVYPHRPERAPGAFHTTAWFALSWRYHALWDEVYSSEAVCDRVNRETGG